MYPPHVMPPGDFIFEKDVKNALGNHNTGIYEIYTDQI